MHFLHARDAGGDATGRAFHPGISGEAREQDVTLPDLGIDDDGVAEALDLGQFRFQFRLYGRIVHGFAHAARTGHDHDGIQYLPGALYFAGLVEPDRFAPAPIAELANTPGSWPGNGCSFATTQGGGLASRLTADAVRQACGTVFTASCREASVCARCALVSDRCGVEAK